MEKSYLNIKQIMEIRHKECEKKRKQCAKIKKDPIALEEKKKKDRQSYYRRKERGKVSSINFKQNGNNV